MTNPGSPHSRAGRRDQHVTATGWRVVGKAISLVGQPSPADALPAGRDDDVLYVARFQMRPRMGTGSAVHSALAALGAAIAREWQDAPALTRDRPVSRAPARFHGLRWEPSGAIGAWTGELVWRHPHPVVSGAPCTTQVLISEQAAHVTMTVRVTADGGITAVRGTVGAGQARPLFLSEMNRANRMVFDSADSEPRVLDDAGIPAFVRDVLLSDNRECPVALLAPLDEGGYAVPPADIADELLGLAHLYVVDRHPATFRLSDELGDRRLSCYWGALRVYMPEFSCADRPDEHPLLVRERLLDPVVRADLVGKLGRYARLRVPMPSGEPETQRTPESSAPPRSSSAGKPVRSSSLAEQPGPASFGESDGAVSSVAAPRHADSRAGLPETAQSAAPSADPAPLAAAMSQLFSTLGGQIGELASTIANLVGANTALADEIARLRTSTAVRATSTTSLERRIGSLESLLQMHLAPPDSSRAMQGEPTAGEASDAGDDEAERISLVDVLRQAATAYGDALLLLDAAERSAADSPYTDVDKLAVILEAMASVARRRQEGALGIPLRVAFRELGIEYRGGISPASSDRHRQQYLVRGNDGQVFDCREHIVLGTSYDPRHCLRIYFTSRAPVEPRFVIGHVGRHLNVESTT